jgi:hypothetical protein
MHETTIGGTSIAVDTGKENTQIIMSWLRQSGEAGTAAQYCDSLEYGRFNDWFLPSKDELNLMYTNLRKKGLGDFEYTWYWSSSEYGSIDGWEQRFSDGAQDDGGNVFKTSEINVRAVRAF